MLYCSLVATVSFVTSIAHFLIKLQRRSRTAPWRHYREGASYDGVRYCEGNYSLTPHNLGKQIKINLNEGKDIYTGLY